MPVIDESHPHKWVWACLLMSGRIAFGSANNASRTIAKLNSGMFELVPEEKQVYSILAVKEITKERTLESVQERLLKKYGASKLIRIN